MAANALASTACTKQWHSVARNAVYSVAILKVQQASRATVTRALSNWRRRGIIRTGQRDLTITDLGALRRIADQKT